MLIEEFIQYLRYEKNHSTHTVCAYGRDLSDFMDFASARGRSGAEALEAGLLREWLLERMEQGLSPRSVQRKRSAVRSYWRYLHKRGHVTTDPFRKVSTPRADKPLPVFLKESEMDRLLRVDEAEKPDFVEIRDQLIVELLYATGMRLSELIGLTDDSVDFGGRTLRVTGKRDKQRLIPFGAPLEKSLCRYLAVRDGQVTDSGRLLVRKDGRPLYPQMVYRMVRGRLSEVSTLDKNSPHVLRHTFATAMLNEGAELNAVKELLGHSSLSATEVYTHTSFAELKKVYKQAHPRA